jgi:GMP synthase-like glutamine amidotransferase
VRALFVQQDHVSPPGPVAAALAERGYDIEEFLVVAEDRFGQPDVTVKFPDPLSYDVIVPMGAPWSVYDHERIGSWVLDEIDFLRRAHDADIPVLGICFGAQALAAALGGSVVPADRPEIGWTQVQTQRPDLVESGPWFQWHSDRWNLPVEVTAFARTEVAEQAYTARRCLGVQFHPELTPTMLQGWLDHGGTEHARERGLDPQRLIDETEANAPAAQQRARRLVHRFLDHVAPDTK